MARRSFAIRGSSISGLGVAGGGAAVTYLLRDEFITDEAAPITTPRTAEPGPGTLTIYDAGTNIAIASSKMTVAQAGNWTGSTVKDAAIGPHVGRALLIDSNHSVNHYENNSLAWYTANNNDGNTSIVICAVRNGAAVEALLDVATNRNIITNHCGWTLNQTKQLAIVQRAAGFYILSKGAGSTGWKLAFETTDYVANNLYPGYSLKTGAMAQDNFQCGDWGGVWASQYGLATDRKATTAVNDTLTTTASFFAEFTMSSMKDGDVLNLTFRKTDADNCWIMRATKANLNNVVTLQLISKQSGTETVISTATCYYCYDLNPRTFRLTVDGNNIQASLFTEQDTSYLVAYTSASFNSTVTGIQTDRIGEEFVAYPIDVDALVPAAFIAAGAAPQTKTVCYEGGSITSFAFSGATGWASRTATNADRVVADGYRLTHYNNGVASTGSDRALANLADEVYAHNPSLVFIEFCVNDSEATSKDSGEKLIRAIRTNLPNANIAMIFMPQATSTSDPTNVKDATLQVYKALCAHYSIPYVDMAAELVRAVGAGEYTVSNYTNDLTHPNAFGGMKAAMLMRSILTSSLILGGTQIGTLPAPLYP